MVDRHRSPCPPPNALQREVLEILIEECTEVTQRATKMLRFGVEEVQPGQDQSNAVRLGYEISDLLEMVDRCGKAGLTEPEWIREGQLRKRRQLARFMQHPIAKERDG